MRIISTQKVNIPNVKPTTVKYTMVYSPYGIYEINQDKIYQHIYQDGPTEQKQGFIIDRSTIHKQPHHCIPFPNLKEHVVEEHYDMGKFTIIVSDHITFTGSIPDIQKYINQYKDK